MSKAKLHLSVAHQTPGRIRMKIPAAKGNPDLLEQIKQTFGILPGIEGIVVNHVTGSVILNYDPDRHDEFHSGFQPHTVPPGPAPHHPPSSEIDELAQKIQDEAEFLAQNSHAARAVVDFFKQLDRQIKKSSGNLVDLKIVLAIFVVGFTVFEVGAAAATPVWVTLVIFGLNHFIEMHQHGPQPGIQATPSFA
ncbi:MAG: hypothetical protein P4L76_04975 [Beijerinckiaceae bacterium]|nr:hypothetical protein [Beijerinckiaceae bacterium]